MAQTSRRPVFAGVLVLAASLAGSGAALAQSPAASMVAAPPAPTDLTGSIAISGSSTVQPISTAVQELFNAGSPGVAITVDGPGTGDGFALFCAGELDIADASRAIKPEGEADVCAQNGVEYIELKVALDGLSVITSAADTQLTCLTFADLYALTGPESTGFDNWSDAQALATELGSTTTFPDAPLTITAPGEESGTYDFFVTTVIAPIATERTRGGSSPRARLPVVPQRPEHRRGRRGHRRQPTTLGWVGYAFVEENLDPIKPIALDRQAMALHRAELRHHLGWHVPHLPPAVHLRQQGQGRGEARAGWLRGLLPDPGRGAVGPPDRAVRGPLTRGVASDRRRVGHPLT